MSTDMTAQPLDSPDPGESSRAPGFRTRILVIDRDPSAVAMLRSILRAQGWEVITGKTAAEGLGKARSEGPDAIVVELDLPDMTGIEFLQTLHEHAVTADIPAIVLSSSAGVTERVACLKAGAVDYLIKPADAQDLIARLRAALDLRQEKAGSVLAVVGSKGGVGTSTIAANLAIALRRQTHRGVAIVDAAIPVGTVDIMLNLQPGANVGHLLPRLDELERADFEAILTRHVSGVEALLLQDLGPEGITPDELHKILLALRRIRGITVVDAGASFDERAASALEIADRLLLVVSPEITSLRGARICLERAKLLGLARERVLLVLNRSPLRGGIRQRDIENALGLSAVVSIPDDIKLVTYSINRGVPVIESHRRSKIAQEIDALAKDIIALAAQQ